MIALILFTMVYHGTFQVRISSQSPAVHPDPRDQRADTREHSAPVSKPKTPTVHSSCTTAKQRPKTQHPTSISRRTRSLRGELACPYLKLSVSSHPVASQTPGTARFGIASGTFLHSTVTTDSTPLPRVSTVSSRILCVGFSGMQNSSGFILGFESHKCSDPQLLKQYL